MSNDVWDSCDCKHYIATWDHPVELALLRKDIGIVANQEEVPKRLYIEDNALFLSCTDFS